MPPSTTVNKNHKANETDVSTAGITVQPFYRQLSNNNIAPQNGLQRANGISEKPFVISADAADC